MRLVFPYAIGKLSHETDPAHEGLGGSGGCNATRQIYASCRRAERNARCGRPANPETRGVPRRRPVWLAAPATGSATVFARWAAWKFTRAGYRAGLARSGLTARP